MKRGGLALTTFCWLVFASAGAMAEGRDPAAAEALFREGRDAMHRGDFTDACAKFRESQRLDPGVGTLMNWADCEEKLGHVASAWEHWHEAIDLGREDARIGYARDRAAALDRRVPHLAITLSGASGGARVLRDDIELGPGSLGSPLPVEPGAHVIRVIEAGHTDRKVVVNLTEGQRANIEVSPGAPLAASSGGPVGAADSETDTGPSPDTTARTTWGWVLFGVGAAGLAGGVASSLVVAHDKKIVDGHCGPDKTCDAIGFDAAQSGKKLLVPNAALFAIGVVGAGVGGYLLLSQKTSAATVVGARVVPHGAILSCEGRF